MIYPFKERFILGIPKTNGLSNPVKPQKKIAQQVGYCVSWWPGAESTRAEDAEPYFLLAP